MDVPDAGGTLMRKFVDNANGSQPSIDGGADRCWYIGSCGRFNIDAIFIVLNLRRLGHEYDTCA